MTKEITLPELGEGIESGDVMEVLVKEGDWIQKEQGVVELETDKATVEVPCSHAGKIIKVHVEPGQTIPIGATMITIEEDAAETPTAAPSEQKPAVPQETAAEQGAASEPVPAETTSSESAPPDPVAQEPVARSEQPSKEPLPQQASEEAAAPSAPKTKPSGNQPPSEITPVSSSPQDGPSADQALAAGPAVRRFAREVGVDLRLVSGSGMGGRVTRDDVLAVVRKASQGARDQAAAEAESESDEWGTIRREKMPKIRRTIAKKMHESWTTVPRVTNYDDADVTELERIRQTSKADYAEKGIKLTSMPFVIKAVAMALKEHPVVNAVVDMEQGQVIYKEYVNVGVAVDTERGLVVPSLRNADQLSISEIARELASLAESVREGKFQVSDLRGSTFTISNLGAIGGTYSTPIINVPEVAILLVGRSRKMPVVVQDEIGIRLMMPLSLSYDHRLVDGGAAARFLNEVINFLTAPSRLLLAP